MHVLCVCVADDDGDKSVSILLDGEESTMEFVDLSDQEVSHLLPQEHKFKRICQTIPRLKN